MKTRFPILFMLFLLFIYPNNLKTSEFGKEGPQNFCSERVTIADRQGASENGDSEVNPTSPKTKSSSCLGINTTQIFSEELERKEPKVLILIIANDDMPALIELQKKWKRYMRSDPKHFEVYFIRGNPDISTPFEIVGDDLFVKTEENYVPGILNKTILSIEAMLPRFKEFDFILRTNLSSFYVFPRLLNFVKTLPKEQCYCGMQLHLPEEWVPQFGMIPFVTGSGFFLSMDLAEMLVREKEVIFELNEQLPDDVLIGYFFDRRHIPSMPAGRIDYPTLQDWVNGKDHIPEDAFHFRAKYELGYRHKEDPYEDEIYIGKELLKMFYPELAE